MPLVRRARHCAGEVSQHLLLDIEVVELTEYILEDTQPSDRFSRHFLGKRAGKKLEHITQLLTGDAQSMQLLGGAVFESVGRCEGEHALTLPTDGFSDQLGQLVFCLRPPGFRLCCRAFPALKNGLGLRGVQRFHQPVMGGVAVMLNDAKKRLHIRSQVWRHGGQIVGLVEQQYVQIAQVVGQATQKGQVLAQVVGQANRKHLGQLAEQGAGAPNGHPEVVQKLGINIVEDTRPVLSDDVEQKGQNRAYRVPGPAYRARM